jgi:thiamine-monophosphate kinase
MKIEELGEDAFLRELPVRFPPRTSLTDAGSVAIGIGDDAAALVPPEGEHILLTTDGLVEGVHFERRFLPPRFLGRKAVAVNVSDIAAMGGAPLGMLLALTVPSDTEVASLWELVGGCDERARELGLSLLGGNLALSPGGIVVDVTVVGATLSRRALRRSGARSGEGLYVSGRLGAAATGLELLKRGAVISPSGGLMVPEALRAGPMTLAEDCIRAHIDPEPRVELGKALNRRKLASSCIDVSDGLALDLHRLCRASGVGAKLEEAALPLSPGLLAWERTFGGDATSRALSGGEDYELLFSSGRERMMDRLRERSDVLVTRIGELTDGESIALERRDGTIEPMPARGWDHFARSRREGRKES